MTRSADSAARDAKIAQLKQLIRAEKYETLEMLEDAVDAFLWHEQDQLQGEFESPTHEIVRSHPK